MVNQFHPDIPFFPSPNFSSRMGCSVEGVVLHYTGSGSTSGTIKWFQMPESKVSAHFVLSREGKFTQMVEIDNAAWHAGASEMNYKGVPKQGANYFTLGIEISNHGPLHLGMDGKFYYELAGTMKLYKQVGTPKQATLVVGGQSITSWWEPYPNDQIIALDWFFQELKKSKYASAINNIRGHEEIAIPVGRKLDPAALFPWALFGRPKGTRITKAIIGGTEV